MSRILKCRLSLSPRFFPARLGYCREPGFRCRTHLSLAPSRWSGCLASRLYLCPPRPLGSTNLGSRSPAHSPLLSRDCAISSLRRCPEKPGQFIAKGIDLFLEVGRSPQLARRQVQYRGIHGPQLKVSPLVESSIQKIAAPAVSLRNLDKEGASFKSVN